MLLELTQGVFVCLPAADAIAGVTDNDDVEVELERIQRGLVHAEVGVDATHEQIGDLCGPKQTGQPRVAERAVVELVDERKLKVVEFRQQFGAGGSRVTNVAVDLAEGRR